MHKIIYSNDQNFTTMFLFLLRLLAEVPVFTNIGEPALADGAIPAVSADA